MSPFLPGTDHRPESAISARRYHQSHWFRVLVDPSVQGGKRLKGNAWKGIVSPRCTPAVTASVWAVARRWADAAGETPDRCIDVSAAAIGQFLLPPGHKEL